MSYDNSKIIGQSIFLDIPIFFTHNQTFEVKDDFYFEFLPPCFLLSSPFWSAFFGCSLGLWGCYGNSTHESQHISQIPRLKKFQLFQLCNTVNSYLGSWLLVRLITYKEQKQNKFFFSNNLCSCFSDKFKIKRKHLVSHLSFLAFWLGSRVCAVFLGGNQCLMLRSPRSFMAPVGEWLRDWGLFQKQQSEKAKSRVSCAARPTARRVSAEARKTSQLTW